MHGNAEAFGGPRDYIKLAVEATCAPGRLRFILGLEDFDFRFA
jgi:hypothetical protein